MYLRTKSKAEKTKTLGSLANKAENFHKSAVFLKTKSLLSWQGTQKIKTAKIVTF
jgi:hypothetical protein